MHPTNGPKIKISVMVAAPAPQEKMQRAESYEDKCAAKIDLLVAKIEDNIAACESNIIESEKEWCYLKCLYVKLRDKKMSKKLLEAAKKIEDLFIKQAGREDVPLDSKYMISLQNTGIGEKDYD